MKMLAFACLTVGVETKNLIRPFKMTHDQNWLRYHFKISISEFSLFLCLHCVSYCNTGYMLVCFICSLRAHK